MRFRLFTFALFLCAASAYSQTASTTPNLGLTLPAYNQPGWSIELNNDLSLIDTAVGRLATGGSPLAFTGTGTKVVSGTGAGASGNCAKWDANGNVVDAGIACVFSAGALVGTNNLSDVANEYTAKGNLGVSMIIDAQKDFGIVADGVTDNTAAFVSLNAALRAAHGIPEVHLPAGTILLHWSDPFFGVKNLVLKSPGKNATHMVNTAETSTARLSFNLGAQDFVCQSYSGSTLGTNAYDFANVQINTVEAGSYTATAKTPSQIATWQAGDDILVTGFDQQGDSSFPPNYRYFDRVTVKSVNTSTGVVTFDKPLTNGYNSAWPYFAATSTTPPAMRNFMHGACASGGSITPMQYLRVEGVDFSQLPAGQSGYLNFVLVGDIRHAVFVDSKFDFISPTTTETFEFINSSANRMEIDKMIDVAYLKHSTIGLNAVDGNYQNLAQGTGANWIIVEDSTIAGGYTGLSPRNLVMRNDNIHSSSLFGWVSAAGWYTRSQLLDNLTLWKDGNTVSSIYSGNALTAITATATPTGSTFTVANLTDVLNSTRILGPGSEIRSSESYSPSTIIGTVNDLYFVGGVLTVSGTWSGTVTPGEVLYIDPNPVNNVIRNPIPADFSLSSVTPFWNFGGPNLAIMLSQQGNGTSVQMAAGSTPTSGDCAKFDANANIVDAGAPCGSGTGTGSSFNALSSGTNTTAAMVIGAGASLAASGGTIAATSVPASGVTGLAASATTDATNASNITSGTLAAARLPATAVTTGSASGNGAKYVSTTAAGASGNCAKWDANGNVVDAGAACGTGSGSGSSGITAPGSTTVGNVPQYSTTTGSALSAGLGVVTSVGSPGSNSNVPTEAAIRTAINAASTASGALPSYTGNQGYLVTNGTSASWGEIVTGPSGALCSGTGCPGGTAGVLDIMTSVVPTKLGQNTFGGMNIFSQISIPTGTPSSSTAACLQAGFLEHDSSYLYVCLTAGASGSALWSRVALTSTGW